MQYFYLCWEETSSYGEFRTFFRTVIFLNPKHEYLLLLSCSFTQGEKLFFWLSQPSAYHCREHYISFKISLYYVRWELHIGDISWEMRWILTYQFNYLTFSESKSLNHPLQFFDKDIQVPNLIFWYKRKR